MGLGLQVRFEVLYRPRSEEEPERMRRRPSLVQSQAQVSDEVERMKGKQNDEIK